MQTILHRALGAALIAAALSVTAGTRELPSIQERVAARQAARASAKKPPPPDGVRAIMRRAAEDLAMAMPEPGLKVGERAPDFALVNSAGKETQLSKVLQRGPVVLTFFRGAWCSYCTIELKALQESLPAFATHNATVLAISPQQQQASQKQLKEHGYTIELLSDLDDAVAKAYQLHFELPPDLVGLYKDKFGLDVEAYNGPGRVGLPVPATFVIDRAGTIRAAFADVDYKKRMEPADILAALEKLSTD
jgi:peroxiredoxin